MRPLGPEPELEPIHKTVTALYREAVRERGAAPDQITVSFSQEGLNRARYETAPGFNPWGDSSFTTYMGLPVQTTRGQQEDVLLKIGR